MDMLPCPGCRTLLPPEATGCQICLRSRTKQEIVRGYAALREEKSRRRKFPFQVAAAVLLAAAGVKLGWDRRDELRAAAAAAKAAAAETAKDLTTPTNLGAPPAAPLQTAGEQLAAVRAAGTPASAPAAEAGAPASAPAPRKPAGPPRKSHWRFAGSVYDLATLSPVPGAEITFLREGSEPVVARADDGGDYEADVEKAEGWQVSLRVPGYREGQVVDIDPPYRSRDEDERRKAVENLSDGDLAPAPVDGGKGGSKTALNLVAVPELWPGR
jgi:hypothetical protein